ncbi:MAG: FRG domain-containing protein [Verrucomicrobiota bacterium]
MREIEEVLVTDVAGFIEELVPPTGFRRFPVYRGLPSRSGMILPSLLREDLSDTEFKSWQQLEAAYLMRLKELSRTQIEAHCELEWMRQGHRFGLPTRLSSWTTNGLIALFEATAATADDEDGVVFRVLPGRSDWVISQDYEQLPDRPRLYVSPVQSDHPMERDECYLVHPIPEGASAPVDFETWYLNSEENLHVSKITVSAEMKGWIRDQLARMSVSARSLKPGMRGICEQIRDDVHRSTDSYDWMLPGA